MTPVGAKSAKNNRSYKAARKVKNNCNSTELQPTVARMRDRDIPFGPPPLLEGEDPDVYYALLSRITEAAKSVDFIDEILVRDIVDLTWEIWRLRRFKAGVLNEGAQTELANVLGPLIRNRETEIENYTNVLKYGPITQKSNPRIAKKLAAGWMARNSAATERVNKLLTSRNVSPHTMIGRALSTNLDLIERLERFIGVIEFRRNAALREMDRHHSVVAELLNNKLLEAEHLEFSTETSEVAPQDDGRT